MSELSAHQPLKMSELSARQARNSTQLSEVSARDERVERRPSAQRDPIAGSGDRLTF